MNPFENLIGGLVSGIMSSAMMFGVITVQTFKYYQKFTEDTPLVKLVVALLWFFQGFQLSCMTQALHRYLILNFGNFETVSAATWELATYQIGIVVASVTVQTFFAYHLYRLSENLCLSIVVGTLIVAQFATGMFVSVKTNILLKTAEIVAHETGITVAWLGLEMLTDCTIAISMCILLRRKRTGFRQTDRAVNIMVMYAVNTGMMTSIVAIMVLCAFAAYGFHWVVLFFGVPFGGFYTVSMLARLHSRSLTRRELLSQDGNSFRLSHLPRRSGPSTLLPIIIDIRQDVRSDGSMHGMSVFAE